MMSIQKFENNLKAVSFGIKYLDYVKNNQIPVEEDGENHHIYMRAICGDNNYLYHLSYFGHTMAHILLAKAGIEGNYWWKDLALSVLCGWFDCRIENMSDIEKAEINALDYSELRRLAYEANGRLISEGHSKRSPEEKAESARKALETKNKNPEKYTESNRRRVIKYKETINKKSPEEKAEQKRKELETKAKKSPEEKKEIQRKRIIKFKETCAKKSPEEKAEQYKKSGKSVSKSLKNRSLEEKEESYKKGWETRNKYPEKKKESFKKGHETRKKKNEGKIKVVKNTGWHANSIKWVWPEELPTYLDAGYKQKVA